MCIYIYIYRERERGAVRQVGSLLSGAPPARINLAKSIGPTVGNTVEAYESSYG